ncbi:MAG: response regulator [Alphaproteobacteria bacterium]|nr:response regulator [Alphaproteobacteria bacterium]
MSDIAIVDDELAICRALAIAFEAEGWPTRMFTDPLVALPALIAVPPRLLILNGHMPGMHGIEFFERFRLYSRCPVVFLSASAEEIEAACAEKGLHAADYVAKPFSTAHLIRVCSQVLPHAHEAREAGR